MRNDKRQSAYSREVAIVRRIQHNIVRHDQRTLGIDRALHVIRSLCMPPPRVASPSGNPPPPEPEQLPNYEERAKDHFVASSQPKRQVDVKVFCAIFCVVGRHIGQWTMTPFHREDRAFDQYHPAQNGRPARMARSTGDWNRNYASHEEEPNCGMY